MLCIRMDFMDLLPMLVCSCTGVSVCTFGFQSQQRHSMLIAEGFQVASITLRQVGVEVTKVSSCSLRKTFLSGSTPACRAIPRLRSSRSPKY